MRLSLSPSLSAAAICAACFISSISAASAATVTIETETGAAMETVFGMRANTGTSGFELAGATVTAAFADGLEETVTWAAEMNPFTASGGAYGTGWSLFQTGDANGAQGLVNLHVPKRVLKNFAINLSTSASILPAFPNSPEVVNGPSVFDVSPDDEGQGDAGSTPGSSFGFPFSVENFAPSNGGTFADAVGAIKVTYSGAVNLQGQSAVGDLFTTMLVDFSGLNNGGFTGMLNYKSDTDTLLIPGDLTPVAPVPLPAGLPLLLAGLGSLTLLRRKKR